MFFLGVLGFAVYRNEALHFSCDPDRRELNLYCYNQFRPITPQVQPVQTHNPSGTTSSDPNPSGTTSSDPNPSGTTSSDPNPSGTTRVLLTLQSPSGVLGAPAGHGAGPWCRVPPLRSLSEHRPGGDPRAAALHRVLHHLCSSTHHSGSHRLLATEPPLWLPGVYLVKLDELNGVLVHVTGVHPAAHPLETLRLNPPAIPKGVTHDVTGSEGST